MKYKKKHEKRTKYKNELFIRTEPSDISRYKTKLTFKLFVCDAKTCVTHFLKWIMLSHASTFFKYKNNAN